MSTNFDIKKFLIKEGLTRVSRDRKRLLKEESEPVQINQKAYELAKEIAAGKVDGYVFYMEDAGIGWDIIPYGGGVSEEEQAGWNMLSPDNDGIWVYSGGKIIPVISFPTVEGDVDSDPNVLKQSELWHELKRISEESIEKGPSVEAIVRTAAGPGYRFILASKLPADRINAKYGDTYFAISANRGWNVEALRGEGEILVPESELKDYITFVIDKGEFEGDTGEEPTKKDAEFEYNYLATGTWED